MYGIFVIKDIRYTRLKNKSAAYFTEHVMLCVVYSAVQSKVTKCVLQKLNTDSARRPNREQKNV